MVLLARPSLVTVLQLYLHNLVLVVFSPQNQELKEMTQSLESYHRKKWMECEKDLHRLR